MPRAADPGPSGIVCMAGPELHQRCTTPNAAAIRVRLRQIAAATPCGDALWQAKESEDQRGTQYCATPSAAAAVPATSQVAPCTYNGITSPSQVIQSNAVTFRFAASKPSHYHPYHLTTLDLGPSVGSITQPKTSPVSLAFSPQEQPKPHQARLACGVGTYAVLSETQSAVVPLESLPRKRPANPASIRVGCFESYLSSSCVFARRQRSISIQVHLIRLLAPALGSLDLSRPLSKPDQTRPDEATACQCAVARLSFKVPCDIYTLFTLSDTCRLPHTIDDFPFWVFDSRYTDFPSCFISPGPFALIALSRRVSSNLAFLLHPSHSFCPSGASSI
ncbi:hypothetical protein TsFJ059_008617 [Trichoderma semiorbis]|uniref:Uncharacterized protein n=1 Tax=Trichoderma semiorbis TaxID=1491008 RepID=A0A9P8KRA2_9HYPO|nr:hypothetical protein TsFJ059_008617 [Trichoderma semiorbis]